MLERPRQLLNRWGGNLFGDSLAQALTLELNKNGAGLITLPITVTTSLLNFIVVVFISIYV